MISSKYRVTAWRTNAGSCSLNFFEFELSYKIEKILY